LNRVLLTGASGFIGRRVLRPLLELGFEVHAVGRAGPPPESDDRVVWHRADILADAQRAAVVQDVNASHLLHLAWYAEPGAFWSARENVLWVAASVRLANEFLHAGGRRIVGAGTCAEYEWGRPVLAEPSTPLRPATLYGVCKDATQRVVRAAAEQAGASFAWGRVFFLYGPGEHPARLVSSLARALVRGEEAQATEGTQQRDFLHVDDVASAFAALLNSSVAGPVNIASGEAVEVREIAKTLARIAGRPELLALGARPTPENEPASIVGDASRLRGELDWEPSIPLQQGLSETLAWWHERLASGGPEHERLPGERSS
jgi:nucleoside-diphosphate-sugar epimerase